MMYWIYGLPNWLFGFLTVLVFCSFGVTGLVATRRWAPSLHHATLSHNDIVGYYFGAITVLYGITLGLLMVGVWSTYTDTKEKVDREAGALAALYLDVSRYPEPNSGRLQDDLRRYTHDVIYFSWPEQQTGMIPKRTDAIMANLAYDLSSFEPTSEAQKILHAEAYQQFNELVQRRRSRVLSVMEGLSGALWTLLLVGAVINIAVTWCFHLHNQRMHIMMTALTSSLLGLMIFLVAAMDHPYLGKLSVSSEPFQLIYEQLMNPATTAGGGPLVPQINFDSSTETERESNSIANPGIAGRRGSVRWFWIALGLAIYVILIGMLASRNRPRRNIDRIDQASRSNSDRQDVNRRNNQIRKVG